LTPVGKSSLWIYISISAPVLLYIYRLVIFSFERYFFFLLSSVAGALLQCSELLIRQHNFFQASRVLSTHGYIRQLILGYFLSLSSFYLLFLSLSSLLYYIYTRIYICVCAFLHSYLIWKTEDSRLVSPAWVVCFFFLLLFLSPFNSLCPLTLASSFLRT
jgi:hypothetical protein